MPDTHTLPSPTHPARMKLEPYSAEIRLPNLTLGIDNIHYDVFLSPRFVDFTRKYLLDLVRQTINISLVYGKDKKRSGTPEHGAFRKMLTEILQESLTRAKYQQSYRDRRPAPTGGAEVHHDGTFEPVFEHRGGVQGMDSRARRTFRAQRAGARDAVEDRGDSGGQKERVPASGRHAAPGVARSGRGNYLQIAAGPFRRRFSRNVRPAAEPVSFRRGRKRRSPFPRALHVAREFRERPGPLRCVRRTCCWISCAISFWRMAMRRS